MLHSATDLFWQVILKLQQASLSPGGLIKNTDRWALTPEFPMQ